MIRRLFRRATVDQALDGLRFQLDCFPSMDYQPLPWLGKHKARRSSGVLSRWRTMEPIIDKHGVKSAVDIGCNVGFFPLSLAEKGIATAGLEADDRYFRSLVFARKVVSASKLAAVNMIVSPETLDLLPTVDCVIFLAVWHHMVKQYGLDTANGLLRGIWSRARKILFFETGEREMPAAFKLPAMEPNTRQFLADYLQESCPDGQVVHLGLHDAFGPGAQGMTKRNLFMVLRKHA